MSTKAMTALSTALILSAVSVPSAASIEPGGGSWATTFAYGWIGLTAILAGMTYLFLRSVQKINLPTM